MVSAYPDPLPYSSFGFQDASLSLGIILILFDNFNIVGDDLLDRRDIVFGDALELSQLVLRHVEQIENILDAGLVQDACDPLAYAGQLGDEGDLLFLVALDFLVVLVRFGRFFHGAEERLAGRRCFDSVSSG